MITVKLYGHLGKRFGKLHRFDISTPAEAIRALAPSIGRRSLGLAQAFQFDLMLRQKDVIGEWVPMGEPGNSTVLREDKKWLRGSKWSEITRTGDGRLVPLNTPLADGHEFLEVFTVAGVWDLIVLDLGCRISTAPWCCAISNGWNSIPRCWC